ncbi:MAG: type II 3-dehydroquinate dehydratase [Acidimicrobiales bacterium]
MISKSTAEPSCEGKVVLLLSGPNLDLLGDRDPETYGRETLAEHVAAATEEASRYGLVVEHHQTNHEGEIVELVHGALGRADAVVINAGALTHYSWSLHDALSAFNGVVVEVHLSNPQAREPWRHTSVVAPVADGTVAGFGGLGYRLAMRAVAELFAAAPREDKTRARPSKGTR